MYYLILHPYAIYLFGIYLISKYIENSHTDYKESSNVKFELKAAVCQMSWMIVKHKWKKPWGVNGHWHRNKFNIKPTNGPWVTPV